MNDVIQYYVIALYVVILVTAAWGAFSTRFDANVLQRIALGGFSLWSVWRISLIAKYGYSWPHEPVVVTAFALYAAGTIQKVLTYHGGEDD